MKPKNGGAWLRETVFGLNDGATTILVMVATTSAVAPLYLAKIVLAAILAGAVSMAGGGLLSGVIERQLLLRRAFEENNKTLWMEAQNIHLVAQTLQVGVAFIVGGLVPALPVFFQWPATRWWAYGFSALAAILFGLVNARYAGGGLARTLGMASLFFAVVTAGTLAGVLFGLVLQGG